MVKLVFLDQLGTHAAVIAASCQAGLLPEETDVSVLLSLPNFAVHQDYSVGNLYLMGTDKEMRPIYTLGVGPEGHTISVSTKDLLAMAEKKAEDIILIDVSSFNTFAIKCCGYLQCLPGLRKVMIYITALLLQPQVQKIKKLVKMKINKQHNPGQPGLFLDSLEEDNG